LGLKEHRVLQVLAARMAFRNGPDPLTIIDTYFPELLTLVEDSLLCDRTVRYALDGLIDNGYLTKTKNPGKKLRKGKDQREQRCDRGGDRWG
jgi:hypothetical protein